MAGTDSQLIAGLYDAANIQDRLKIYAQNKDYFRFWALRQINTISLLKIISEKFGTVPADNISEWKFKYPEFDEIPASFFAAEASNTTNANNLNIAVDNEQGAILNSSTRLQVEGIWTKSVVTAANDTDQVATAMDAAKGIVLPEVIRVVNVGAEDSAGVGKRLVSLRRCHPNDGFTGTPPAITTAMKLTVVNLVARSNGLPLPPFSKNSKMLENVIQITRQSYGVGELMTQGGGIETYLAKGQEYLNINYQLAETFLMKVIERALITGRKSEKSIGNDMEMETGGLLEFIMADSDHIIDLKGQLPTVTTMNGIIRRMADVCGVREIWMFTGTEASEQLANQYDGKTIYQTNGQLSLKYQMKIMTLESVGRDMIVHHVTAPILNELGMANEALCLNLSEYNYNEKSKFGSFQIAYKVPFEDCPKGAQSYKENEGYKGKWRELYGAWGLVRRLPETHFRIINFPKAR